MSSGLSVDPSDNVTCGGSAPAPAAAAAMRKKEEDIRMSKIEINFINAERREIIIQTPEKKVAQQMKCPNFCKSNVHDERNERNFIWPSSFSITQSFCMKAPLAAAWLLTFLSSTQFEDILSQNLPTSVARIHLF